MGSRYHQKQAVLLLYINPENGQEVLSVSRKDDHKLLGLPGGKSEEEETLINSLVREVKEELGVDLDRNKIEFLFQDFDQDFDTLTYLYSGLINFNKELPYINDEGAKVEFVPASALIDPIQSPFSDYNLKMLDRFSTDLDFISYQKNNH